MDCSNNDYDSTIIVSYQLSVSVLYCSCPELRSLILVSQLIIKSLLYNRSLITNDVHNYYY